VDAVKRKVISELFLAPSVVLPIVGGISAGLLSWASGGSTYLSGAAIAGVLGGIGWMLTRMVFKVEDITEAAMGAQLDKKLRQENAELDALAAKLRTDRDHRTQDYLTLLRSLRADFETEAAEHGAHFRSAQVREKVSQIFHAAVEQLEESYKLWERSQKLSGDAQNRLLHQREQVLKEIEETVVRIGESVDHFRELMRAEKKIDLAALREELDATMRVAKRTEERMREMEHPSSDHESFVNE
jgi:exonuclease VII small subunit